MKKVLIYNSKFGAVEKVVSMIQEKNKDISVHNIQEGKIDVSHYEVVIIGGNVIAGNINKQLKEFCNQNENKKVILFISGINENIEEVIKQNFSQTFQENIQYYYFVGGQLNFTNMNILEKAIIKAVNKKEKMISNIDTKKDYDFLKYDKIESLITKIENI